MKTCKSFFIRWLTVSSDDCSQEEKSVIDIEHIQSGDKCRLSSLEEVSLWMREIDTDSEEQRTKSERS